MSRSLNGGMGLNEVKLLVIMLPRRVTTQFSVPQVCSSESWFLGKLLTSKVNTVWLLNKNAV